MEINVTQKIKLIIADIKLDNSPKTQKIFRLTQNQIETLKKLSEAFRLNYQETVAVALLYMTAAEGLQELDSEKILKELRGNIQEEEKKQEPVFDAIKLYREGSHEEIDEFIRERWLTDLLGPSRWNWVKRWLETSGEDLHWAIEFYEKKLLEIFKDPFCCQGCENKDECPAWEMNRAKSWDEIKDEVFNAFRSINCPENLQEDNGEEASSSST
jgi:hypothetical protein